MFTAKRRAFLNNGSNFFVVAVVCANPMVPSECACIRTCDEPDSCDSTCKSGCVCPDGLLFHNNACVPADSCPCYDEETETLYSVSTVVILQFVICAKIIVQLGIITKDPKSCSQNLANNFFFICRRN